jgi:hypothetical protein
MPCTYYTPEEERDIAHREHTKTAHQLKNIEAMLCGVLSCLEVDGGFDRVIDRLDYKEMGVTKKQVLDWWHDHQEQDKSRRETEERVRLAREKAAVEERERKRIAKKALEKLTAKEKKAIGL